MFLKHESTGSSVATMQNDFINKEAEIYITKQGFINFVNDTACKMLSIDANVTAEGEKISDYLPFNITSLQNAFQSIIGNTFTSKSNTIIPAVNAQFSYTFSLDGENQLVKLTLRKNPFL